MNSPKEAIEALGEAWGFAEIAQVYLAKNAEKHSLILVASRDVVDGMDYLRAAATLLETPEVQAVLGREDETITL